MTTEVAGFPTHVRSIGSGRRRVIALHCSLAHSGEWTGIAAHLPGVTTVAPDLPGHGRSADWDGRADLHDLATGIATALAAAEPAPVDMIGHSFGATVALRVALERPDLIRSLVLVEPVLFAAATGTPSHADHLARHAPVMAALLAGEDAAAAGHFHAVWGDGQRLSAMPEAQQAYITGRIRQIGALNDMLEGDGAGLLAPGRLESLALPVLLLGGGASVPVAATIMTALAQRLPDARRVTVPGAGHMLPMTHASEVAAAIADHLARSWPRSAAISPSTSASVVDHEQTSRTPDSPPGMGQA